MSRPYNSPRRAATAEQTRRDIIEAAIRLHAQGVTDLAELAVEAGVALPTVRKHFSTREGVFKACTAHVAQSAEPFPIAELARIASPVERISATVHRLYGLFDARLGLTWTAYRLAGESPAFAEVLDRNSALVRRLTTMLVTKAGSAIPKEHRNAVTGFVHGLLSPLAYRALRVEGGLDLDSAADQAAAAIGRVLGAHASI
jgi:AcrR family transcriptional regulator